jgi:hypothetical protein
MPEQPWLTLRDGTEIRIGDPIRVELGPEESYEGNLNEINERLGYITVTNTGHSPIPDYGATLGFPLADIQKVEKL